MIKSPPPIDMLWEWNVDSLEYQGEWCIGRRELCRRSMHCSCKSYGALFNLFAALFPWTSGTAPRSPECGPSVPQTNSGHAE